MIPQIRVTEGTYSSRLWQFVKGNSDVFRYLVAEMYARGLSTRDIEATFTDEQGNCLISKSAVSEVTETLWEDYLAFSKRDLSSFEVAYIFLDAVYEPMRMFKGRKEGILCAWACRAAKGTERPAKHLRKAAAAKSKKDRLKSVIVGFNTEHVCN